MRKLASIRRINAIDPIPGADAIEVATIDGWKVVVKKGEFSVGDRCVYFEIDSVLPILPEFEFLRKSCYIKKDWLPAGEGFRLKTIKLRGQISQGLALPVTAVFPDGVAFLDDGADITCTLNVIKYDPPIPAQLAGRVKGNFPSFIPKTDQERIQNVADKVFSEYYNHPFEITLKLDGSSCTVYYNDARFGVCSRNLELAIEDENKDNSFIRVAIDSNLNTALACIGRNIAVQGELMGPDVQGNPEKLERHMLFIFDIFDIDNQRYLTPDERVEFYHKLISNGLNDSIVTHVPVVVRNLCPSRFGSVEEMLKFAEMPSIAAETAEGLVWKSEVSNFSFKTISNKFLLSEK